MAEKDNKRNTSSHSGKSNPSDSGHDKATIKEGKTSEELKKEEEIREKHTDGGEIPSHLKKDANTNPNKPDIDKPGYGGT